MRHGMISTQVTNKRPKIPTSVTVMDVRSAESGFTLDSHGFQYHDYHTNDEGDFRHDDDEDGEALDRY